MIIRRLTVNGNRRSSVSGPGARRNKERTKLLLKFFLSHSARMVQLSADMQWALDQLPEAYRWAVLLADVEEFTYQEIAATMECPVGTVMSRISRGRSMLGRLLNERRRADRPAIRIVARER